MRRISQPGAGWRAGILCCAFAVGLRGQESVVQNLEADGVEARLSVDPIHTTTAGRIVADFSVSAPSSVTVAINPPAPQPLGQLSIAAATSRGPVVVRPGVMEYGLRIDFTPFLGGSYEVPPFTVGYRSSRKAGQLVTKPVPVRVTSVVEGDPAEARPAGLLAIDEPPVRRLWRWSSALGVGVLVLAIVGGWMRRRRRQSNPKPDTVLAPAAAALAVLESDAMLTASGLERVIESLRAHEPDPLPERLRHPYLWIRFGFPTSTEVDQFGNSLKHYLREKSRRETPRGVA